MWVWLFAVVEALHSCDFGRLPMMYINLDSQPRRNAMMEREFPQALRLSAVNGHDKEMLSAVLDFDGVNANASVRYDLMASQFDRMMALTKNMTQPLTSAPYVDDRHKAASDPSDPTDPSSSVVMPYPRPQQSLGLASLDQMGKFIRAQLDAHLGESGCTMSMYKALLRAYQLGYAHFILAEDDVGAHLCPFHHSKITTILAQVHQANPEWEVIRLQWSASSHYFSKVMDKHITEVKSQVHGPNGWNSYAEQNYGRWTNITAVARLNRGYGSVINLWSRRGVIRHLKRILLPNGKFLCHRRCVSDVIASDPGSHYPGINGVKNPPSLTYITLPPYFANELGEAGSQIRESKTHHEFHLTVSALAVQWYLELREVVKKHAKDLYPEPLKWYASGQKR